VFSESKNFPEIAEFYREQVIERGRVLFHKMLQRGIDQGELGAIDTHMATLSLMSAMLFVCMWRHAMVGEAPKPDFEPKAFLMAHLETVLRGLAASTEQGHQRT